MKTVLNRFAILPFGGRMLLFVLVCLAAVATSGSAATPSDAVGQSGSLRFRRVFIPEGMKDWPQGKIKYLPMDAAEFERLVGAIERAAPGLPSQSTAGLVQAEYDCRLKGRSLQGNALLEFSPEIPVATLVTLDPCNLAISRAQWITSEGAAAAFGMSGDGRLQVLAECGGQLRFDWSLSGQADAEGTSFAVHLPPGPLNRVRMELASELQPTVDRGIVSDAGQAGQGTRHWTIELGGRSSCQLHVGKPTENDSPRRQLLVARQSTEYEFSLHGADVTMELNLDDHRDPVRRLTLNVEPPLELVAAAAGDLPLSWNVASRSGGKWPQASVELPPPLQTGPVKLRFRAIASLTTAESWKLPRMLAEGVVGRASTMRLAVLPPLSLASLTPHGCRQTSVSVSAADAGEQSEFELYDADGGLELSLVRRMSEVRATTATATALGQGKMIGRVTADFRTDEGPIFDLEAAVLPRWTIDSVVSQPTDALDDWTLDFRARKLSIRLAHPLTAARPVRLIVSARRLYAVPGRDLRIDDVVPLRFSTSVNSRRLLDLHASGANELRVSGGNMPWRMDIKDLTAAELDLFAEPPGEALLRDDGAAASLRFSLEERRPAYSADIRVEAIVGSGMLEEDYTLLCTPAKTAPIDRLVVQFAGRRDAPLNWSVGGMDETGFSTRRWTAAQVSAAGLNAGEEAWDVVFRNRQSGPVRLHAVRKTKIGGSGPTDAFPVCLASLPDAAAQEAKVVVRSLGPQTVRVAAHRLTPLPIQAVAADQLQTVRAAFRYDPRDEIASGAKPAIMLTCADSQTPLAWAWDCQVDSQFATSGLGEHQVTYHIENAGRRQVELRLPGAVARRDVHRMEINGRPATVSTDDAAAETLKVNLPANIKNVVLTLRISTRGAGLATFHRLRPPIPEVDLPILVQHWSLAIPPGYATITSVNAAEGAAEGYSIRRRLLGILARSDQQGVFNPLRGSDYRAMFSQLWGENVADNAREAAEPAGWSRCRMDLDQGAAGVTIIYRPTIDATGWLLFLSVVALGAWRPAARPLPLIILAVALGTLALLLPESLATVFTRGLLGLGFCLLWKFAARRSRSQRRQSSKPRDLPSTLTNVVPFAAPDVVPFAAPVLAALMVFCAAAEAADNTKDAPSLHSVFIPVDAKQEPSGAKYFVPEAFYAELYRRAAVHGEMPQGWMIVSAVYRAALVEDAALRDLVVDRLTAEYEIRVFDPGVRVRIPLRREEVSLVPDQAKLDDRQVQPDWDSDGNGLLLDIAEPGEYRLGLALRPSAAADKRAGGLDLEVPRVPTARLEVTAPAADTPLVFPSALGAVDREEIPPRWIAELGPSSRLTVRWRNAPSDSTGPIDVDQLQWLTIGPGRVLVNVRMKVKAATGQLSRLRVKADTSLELLADAPTVVRSIAAPGSETTQILDVQLPKPAAETMLDLHFLCNGQSGLGTLRTPQIEVVDSRIGRHWLAVSVDPSFEYLQPGGRLLETAAVADFLKSWGPADTSPDAAFRLDGNSAEWSMTTRVRKPETTSDQNISWSFDTSSASMRFDAQLATSGGKTFQYRFRLPPELRVDSLSVSRDGASIPVRWALDSGGHLTVFLRTAAIGRHQLRLDGRMSWANSRKAPLPHVSLEDVRVQNGVVRIYRGPSALVDVSAPAGVAEVKSFGEGVVPAELGQPVRSFYLDPADAGRISVAVQPDRALAAKETEGADHAPAPAPPALVGEARVAAANLRFTWQADGRRIALADFEVESPAVADYRLRVPEGFELLQLTVDGIPVDAVRTDARDSGGLAKGIGSARSPETTWLVPLASPKPRVRINAILVAGPSPSASPASTGRITFPSPQIGDLPVARTRWLIALPDGVQATSAALDGNLALPAPASGEETSDLAAHWRQFAANCGSVVSYASDGVCDSITVDFRGTVSEGWPWRAAGTAGFLGMMAVIYCLLRNGLPSDLLVRWSEYIAVAIGIAWWLWASPSVFGLAIVLAVAGRRIAVRSGLLRPIAAGDAV